VKLEFRAGYNRGVFHATGMDWQRRPCAQRSAALYGHSNNLPPYRSSSVVLGDEIVPRGKIRRDLSQKLHLVELLPAL
jgi:hypothetical protein